MLLLKPVYSGHRQHPMIHIELTDLNIFSKPKLIVRILVSHLSHLLGDGVQSFVLRLGVG